MAWGNNSHRICLRIGTESYHRRESKKACKLKLIPEESEIVRLIYSLYIEHDSLTSVEAELIKRGLKTKNNKLFTRFSIKSILQNPVYMIADVNAYNFL